MLEGALHGAELEAAVSMLTGVVACPSIMFGTLPDDEVIAAAVDIVLRSAAPDGRRSVRSTTPSSGLGRGRRPPIRRLADAPGTLGLWPCCRKCPCRTQCRFFARDE